MTTRTPLAFAYMFMALLGLALIAPTMPPFQNADEPNHLFRADQISHLGLLPQRLPDGEQGGWVDAGLVKAATPFLALRFHPEAKISRPLYARQAWGLPSPVGFPNTALYSPAFYLPQAVALYIARHWPLTVLQGTTLARLAAGGAAILLGAAAIGLGTSGAIWLYAILLLPMSLSLTAAAAQDGLLLASTALAAALIQTLRRQPSLARLAAATLLFALIACARPPYAAFSAALLLAPFPLFHRLCGIAAVFVAMLAWSAVVAPHVVLPIFPYGAVNPTAQAAGLLHAPSHLATLLAATWEARSDQLFEQFIGRLGWLDTGLPLFFQPLAWNMLLWTALMAIVGCRWERPRLAFWLTAGGILAAVAGIVLIQLLTWTVPGAPVIDGLQGRYFLPPALMLATLLPPGARETSIVRWSYWPVLAFPALGIAVTMHALLLRYYF